MFSFMKVKVWPWLIAIAGAALSVFVVIVRTLTKQNSRLRGRVEVAEARVNHARVVAKKDMELIQNEQQQEATITNELKNGRTDYDPSDLFRVRDNKDND